jgi:hypothetical protein
MAFSLSRYLLHGNSVTATVRLIPSHRREFTNARFNSFLMFRAIAFYLSTINFHHSTILNPVNRKPFRSANPSQCPNLEP